MRDRLTITVMRRRFDKAGLKLFIAAFKAQRDVRQSELT